MRGQRSKRSANAGTAVTEAALVMVPLLFFLLLIPGIAVLRANDLNARTEAHRDMFDKTTTIMLIPEPMTSQATANERRHPLPTFPPPSSAWPTSLRYVKGKGRAATVGGKGNVKIFPDGLPNQFVEGWKYREPFEVPGGWWAREVDLMRYGAVIRSPWTYLGWPFVPTQDMIWEPLQVQGWYGEKGVHKKAKAWLHLMD